MTTGMPLLPVREGERLVPGGRPCGAGKLRSTVRAPPGGKILCPEDTGCEKDVAGGNAVTTYVPSGSPVALYCPSELVKVRKAQGPLGWPSVPVWQTCPTNVLRF